MLGSSGQQSPEAGSQWGFLPNELLVQVLQRLSLAGIPGARGACRQWNALCAESTHTLRPSSYVDDEELASLPDLFPAVSSLQLIGCLAVRGPGLEHLSRLTGLASLEILNCGSGHCCFPYSAARCTNLTRLALGGSLAASGLAGVAALPRLRSLTLAWDPGWSRVPRADLLGLRLATGLRSLVLRGPSYTRLMDQPLREALPLMTSLTHLEFSAGSFVSREFAWPQGLASLSVVACDCPTYGGMAACIESLARDTAGLVSLQLRDIEIDRGSAPLDQQQQPFAALQSLDVGGSTADWVNDRVLGELAVAAPDLRRLDVASTGRERRPSWYCISDAGLIAVGMLLTRLTSLNISHLVKPTWKGLEHLTTLSHLTELRMAGSNWVHRSCWGPLARFRQLALLDVSGSEGFGNAGLRHLANLTRLKDLNIARCEQVSPLGLMRASWLTRLTSLDVTGCCQLARQGPWDLREAPFAPALRGLPSHKPCPFAALAKFSALPHVTIEVMEHGADRDYKRRRRRQGHRRRRDSGYHADQRAACVRRTLLLLKGSIVQI